MYANLRRRLLAVAASLPACASQGSGELAIPAASDSAPTVATAPPPSANLPLPTKDPRDAAWSVPGGLCMPAWATNAKDVGSHADGSAKCGPGPGDWIWDSKFARGRTYYTYSADVSRSQTAARGDACCYEEHIAHVVKGRPLPGGAVAVLREGAGWCPEQPALRADAGLAHAWLADALDEHASVAAFAALSLDLLALGAPSELVRLAHEAALDEVRHAELCFSLAARHGARVEPGALALPPTLQATSRLELARRSLEGGCIGEALAALEAFEAAEACEEEALRGALLQIAADEARHAELAVRVVAWALRTASPEERAAITHELRRPRVAPTPHASIAGDGRLGPARRAAIHARALEEVVEPLLRALADAA